MGKDAGYGQAFHDKWVTLPNPTADLQGRTVVITGGNTGLGFTTAELYLRMPNPPARLILAVRSLEKGEAARMTLLELGLPLEDTAIEVWRVDLSSFNSVLAFVKRMEQELDRLDIFIANAGIDTGVYKQTADGWESGLQTNVLSTFLMSILVLPLLRRTAKLGSPLIGGSFLKPHLVIVASDIHTLARFSQKSQPNVFQALNDPAQFVGHQGGVNDQYAITKLLDVLFTRELGTRLQNEEAIVVCSVNPGLCQTEFIKEAPALVKWLLLAALGKPAVEGAKSYVWASIQNDIPQGSYISSAKVEEPSIFADSPEGFALQSKMWAEMMEILSRVSPDIRRALRG